MLIITRRDGESVKIGPDITVTVLSIARGSVRIGIDAPKNVSILRPDAKVQTEKGPE